MYANIRNERATLKGIVKF